MVIPTLTVTIPGFIWEAVSKDCPLEGVPEASGWEIINEGENGRSIPQLD